MTDTRHDEAALMTRSQLLAMRQVDTYLTTIYGRLERGRAANFARGLWKSHVVAGNYCLRSVIAYAYHLFKDSNGLIITELPHLVRFLVKSMHLRTLPTIKTVMDIVAAVKRRRDLKVYREGECVDLLEPLLCPLGRLQKAAWKFRTHVVGWYAADGTARVYALARQQAVLLSMKFSGGVVGETNYRCSVLALEKILARRGSKSAAAVAALRGETVFVGNAKDPIDWDRTASAAVLLLLLSLGFKYEDMDLEEISDFGFADHSDGAMKMGVVDVKEAIQAANESIDRHLSRLQHADRWVRFFWGLPKYWKYRRVASCIHANGDDIIKLGALYLDEVLEGTSHTVFD